MNLDGVRGRPQFVAYAMAACHMIMWQVTAPLIPLYLSDLGASSVGLGLIMGAAGILPLFIGVHLGAMVDLYGPAIVAQWSGVVGIASFLALASSADLRSVTVAYTLIGVAQMGLTVSSQTLVAEWSTGATRDRNFGYYSFWVSSGMVIGPVVGGLAADLWGFRTALLLGATLAFPVLGLALLLKPRPSHGSLDRAFRSAFNAAGGMIQNPTIALTLVISFLIVFAYSLKQSFYPLYLRHVGLSTTLIGTIFAIHSISSMLVRPLLGWGVTRFGYTRMLLSGIAFAALGMGAIPLVVHFAPLAAAAAVVGIAMGLTQPLTMSIIAGAVGPELRGLALGVRLTTQRLAVAISPVIFGLVTTGLGIGTAFYTAALVLTGAMLGATRFSAVVSQSLPTAVGELVPGKRHQ